MSQLFQSAKLLLLDMASTVLLLVAYALTGKMSVAVALGIAFGVTQIGWEFIRRQPVDRMQYLSLFLVVVSGATALLTQDPRIVMLKPSVIYVAVGIAMLKPGWMNRYLPPAAVQWVPDIGVAFGYVWAGLMFASAVLNVVAAFNFGLLQWSAYMSLFAVVSKLVLFLIQYVTMRAIGRRRARTEVAA